MGAEGYTRVTKCKKNLADALAAAGMVLLCFVCMFPVAIMAQEPELCVDPEAPLPEIFKAVEEAVARLEKLPAKTFVLSRRSDAMKAREWQEIANLDGQLMNYIILRDLRGIEALELKWRQYPAQCREKRILLLLLSRNHLPEHFDDTPHPDGNIRYWDLSAWNPASREYQERREEIEYIRKHGRAAYDRIEDLIVKGYSENRWTAGFILGGCFLWWFACTALYPFLRRKEDGHDLPTTASVIVRWLGILVPLMVLAISLVIEIIKI